jgi:hypothetical protein
MITPHSHRRVCGNLAKRSKRYIQATPVMEGKGKETVCICGGLLQYKRGGSVALIPYSAFTAS